MIYLIIIITLATILLVYVGLSIKNSQRKLSGQAYKQIMSLWSAMEKIQDPVRKVMESDAIFDRTLKELGYEGSLGDKLKDAENRIPNIDEVWRAHKLRNRLAHEPGGSVSEKEVKGALNAFKKAIKYFS